MDFILNRPIFMRDSDGNQHDSYVPVNCKVTLDNDTGEAYFYEEKGEDFVLVSTQPWECLPDGTRKDFNTESQCVDFYKRSNHHVDV